MKQPAPDYRRLSLRVLRIAVLFLIFVLLVTYGGFPDQQKRPEDANEPRGTSIAAELFSEEIYWPTEEWQTSSPEMQGMDSAELANLFDLTSTTILSRIRSILIIRHGILVLEVYAPSVGPDIAQPIYSCTKSFTSALVGIALEKGYLPSIHHRVLDFFPNRQVENLDLRKKSITLENLLTMTSGVNWWEYKAFDSNNTLMQMETSSDWVQFFLDRPMSEDPGAHWNYNTGGAHVLSAILQKQSGKKLSDFAAENLFTLIGITSVSWPADSKGISYGGRGIYLTARDMARFGYLYAREGMWAGRPVVPAGWVRESTKKRFTALFGQDYAYLWWVPAFGGFAANGFQGQRIFVIPEQDIVIVFTASFTGAEMMTEPESLVSSFILPAVKSWQALPENHAGEARLNERLEAFRQNP